MATPKKQLKDVVVNIRRKYKTARTSEAFLVAKVLEEYGFYLDPYKVRLLQHIEKEVKISSIIRAGQKLVQEEKLNNEIESLQTLPPIFVSAPVKPRRGVFGRLFRHRTRRTFRRFSRLDAGTAKGQAERQIHRQAFREDGTNQ